MMLGASGCAEKRKISWRTFSRPGMNIFSEHTAASTGEREREEEVRALVDGDVQDSSSFSPSSRHIIERKEKRQALF